MELMHSEYLWKASSEIIAESNLKKYTAWLKVHKGLTFKDYTGLYKWSVNSLDEFWESLLHYFVVEYNGSYNQVRSQDLMPYVKWFEGIKLNYAEHIFRNKNLNHPAIISFAESSEIRQISWSELESNVASIQKFFQSAGLECGDRVAAYLPNIPEASISLLSTLASGLIWSSCSPDFGAGSVIDRFQQIQPRVLFAVPGYYYNGKLYDKRDQLQEIITQVTSIESVVWICNVPLEIPSLENRISFHWEELIQNSDASLKFIRVPFDHPMWILYSSGTTGLPKAIVHGHGGMLLEHCKYLSLQNDVKSGERFFWFTTTGWMMWNFVHASLLVGATAILYDGSPAYPDLEYLWKKSSEIGIHHFGTSAPFLLACAKANLQLIDKFPQMALRSIGSTGSPLPPEVFQFVYSNIKKDLWLCSMSGGTDVCTAFVGSCIERPVYQGEIQCRALGVGLEVWNDDGQSVLEEMGELMITKPMPCMPVKFWNDSTYEVYKKSYFDEHPGFWRHGDWIEITKHDGLIIYGRSDATLNRHGVRIGTAEIYNALNALEEIKDSLVVNLELEGGKHYMPLFIMLKPGFELDDNLKYKVNSELRLKCSPRHVPDFIFQIQDIPYTISGKKMESPVKKLLLNRDISKVYNPDAMKNPESMLYFIQNRIEILKKFTG